MHEQQVVVTDAEAMEIIDNRSKRMRLPTHRSILPEWEGDYDPATPGPQTDIHPSNKGYRRIASTFAGLIEDLDLLGDDD